MKIFDRKKKKQLTEIDVIVAQHRRQTAELVRTLEKQRMVCAVTAKAR